MTPAPYLCESPVHFPGFAFMSEQKLAQRSRPHAERGKRLRARKEQLIAEGVLRDDLKEIAKLAGVSVSGFQQWERGETWPRDKSRAKLAGVMRWTVQELDHGPQLSTEQSGDSEMPSHPVSPDEMELLALYRGLEDEKQEAKKILAARLHARHLLKGNIRGPLKPISDTGVEEKMPVTKKKGKLPGKKRDASRD